MGYIADDKALFQVQLMATEVAFLKGRAQRLGWSNSQFGAAVIEWWMDQGCPPVDVIEVGLAPMIYEGPRIRPRPPLPKPPGSSGGGSRMRTKEWNGARQ